MSEQPVPPLDTAAPSSPSSSFIQDNWQHVALLVTAIVSIPVTPLWPVMGIIRGVTAYRSFITGGKSFGQIGAEARYTRKAKIAYSEQRGAINLGRSAQSDTLTATRNWVMFRLIRLIIVIVLWPLIEIYFQGRYLYAASKEAKQTSAATV